MYPGGYTAEVTSLSPEATEKEVYEFFVNCGPIEFVEIIRSGEYACTAYVTFKDRYALETALLLSGARIADRHVCISRWGSFVDESDPWSWKPESNSTTAINANQFVSSPGEAITIAQDVVKTMLAKGYDLGKDVLVKAKAFDESHQVSTSAVSRVAELSNRIGLTERINSGVEMVRSIDERFHVSEITKSAAVVTGTAAVVAVTVTGEAAAAAASAVVNSSYFSKGALWVSDVLSRAAKTTSDLATQGGKWLCEPNSWSRSSGQNSTRGAVRLSSTCRYMFIREILRVARTDRSLIDRSNFKDDLDAASLRSIKPSNHHQPFCGH